MRAIKKACRMTSVSCSGIGRTERREEVGNASSQARPVQPRPGLVGRQPTYRYPFPGPPHPWDAEGRISVVARDRAGCFEERSESPRREGQRQDRLGRVLGSMLGWLKPSTRTRKPAGPFPSPPIGDDTPDPTTASQSQRPFTCSTL